MKKPMHPMLKDLLWTLAAIVIIILWMTLP